jgi:hypothetical protein
MKIIGRKDFRTTDLFTAHYTRIKIGLLDVQKLILSTLAASQIMVTVSNPFFIACIALNNKSWRVLLSFACDWPAPFKQAAWPEQKEYSVIFPNVEV